MFFFRHPKPVVDRRPVAEHSVQVEATDLPVLIELTETAKPHEPPCVPREAPDDRADKADKNANGKDRPR